MMWPKLNRKRNRVGVSSMVKSAIQMTHGATVQVRLREADDRGFVLVNEHHFALAIDHALDVSSALRKGINTLKMVVDNTGEAVPFIGRLPGGPWSGRFELYIAGGLVGAYADKGNDGPLRDQHIVAEIELLVTDPDPDEKNDSQKKKRSWPKRILGH
jgi:hypothetical protein